jgi:hypothetical protein
MTPWDRDETLRLAAEQVEAAVQMLTQWREWEQHQIARAQITDVLCLLSQNELAARLRAVREQT